jgi:hypothetical protein
VEYTNKSFILKRKEGKEGGEEGDGEDSVRTFGKGYIYICMEMDIVWKYIYMYGKVYIYIYMEMYIYVWEYIYMEIYLSM